MREHQALSLALGIRFVFSLGFFFFLFFFIFKLYNIVLVLPNIEMNPLCSHSGSYTCWSTSNTHLIRPVYRGLSTGLGFLGLLLLIFGTLEYWITFSGSASLGKRHKPFPLKTRLLDAGEIVYLRSQKFKAFTKLFFRSQVNNLMSWLLLFL